MNLKLAHRKVADHFIAKKRRCPGLITYLLLLLFVISACSETDYRNEPKAKLSDGVPSRSSTLALFDQDRRLVVVNQDRNSVSLFQLKDATGKDVNIKLTEIKVGDEPRCIAIHPGNKTAFVTNALSDKYGGKRNGSGTVSIINLDDAKSDVEAVIEVGTEARGCALTPHGDRLYVANLTEGTVSVIDTKAAKVVDTVTVGGNPMAIAITDDGDGDDMDETVYVTDFYARPIAAKLAAGRAEGFDDGKQGIVHTFAVNDKNMHQTIVLSPLADSGFSADRKNFCKQINVNAHSDLYCPDTAVLDAADPKIKDDPQGVFPNQFYAALIRGKYLYLPNLGASPEPPVRFNVNVQALVHVVALDQSKEAAELHINLNTQVRNEPAIADGVAPNTTLQKLFGNRPAAIDANAAGTDFVIVSRGGDFVFRAGLDASGRIEIKKDAQGRLLRIPTGHTPNGVVMSADAKRAYVNNEVGYSLTVIDLEKNQVLALNLASSDLPVVASAEHEILLGKLSFETALGIPNNGIEQTGIHAIDTLANRGKASDNAWSSCTSCHVEGLADGVTWILADGPRQTIPLNGFFAKNAAFDQRIGNWSAVRGSVTDANINARNVQGGTGFVDDPAVIFNHGPRTADKGGNASRDAATAWVKTVRTLNMPETQASDLEQGRDAFITYCAACHGGAKWTKSQIIYKDNPFMNENPLAPNANLANNNDPRVTVKAGGQIFSFTDAVSTQTLQLMHDVGTFAILDAGEIRANGTRAAGIDGFNVPSLLGVGFSAPYLHHGRAATLAEVFALHALSDGELTRPIAEVVPRDALTQLQAYLKTIDAHTPVLESETDQFCQNLKICENR